MHSTHKLFVLTKYVLSVSRHLFRFVSEDLQLIGGRMQRVSRYQCQMTNMRERKGGAGNELQARMIA